MKTLLSLLIALLFSNLTIAQTTAIPDPNFEQALINLGYDAVLDGAVLTSNINTVNWLDVSNSNISDLTGIQDFIALNTLWCSGNQLSFLDVSQNSMLYDLVCSENQLGNLNLTLNTALEYLSCGNNFLFNLNLSQNINLEFLDIGNTIVLDQNNNFIGGGNYMPNIDITQNTALTFLRCDGVGLDSLYLIPNTALTFLDCEWNNLDSLDVSLNTNLTRIEFGGNLIPTIDLTQNVALTIIHCWVGQLSNLDVTQNTLLTSLDCRYNQFSSLDLTQNTVLDLLWCNNNLLTSLDLSQNTVLTELACGTNQLNSINLTQNTTLTTLTCSQNQLNNLDLSQNLSLLHLQCRDNQLTSLNLSANTSLVQLYCDSNNLSCLNVKNGNNLNLAWFSSYNNPNLTCIEVDNDVWSNTNWTAIDPASSFSTNCNNNCSGLPCSIYANYSTTDNGNGNYTFTNSSFGNYNKIHWAFGDGTTTTTPSPSHTFAADGIYTVVLTITDTIISASCIDYHLDSITVTGVPSPAQCAAGFVMYPDTTTGDVTVVNSSTGTNLTYLWDFGDGNTSTLQNPNHTYLTAGPFYLCLTIDDGNGCINQYCDSIGENGVVFKTGGFTINVISPTTTGLNNEVKLNSEVDTYPNPTSNQLTIDTELKISKIKITDISGKTIKTITTDLDLNVINVADLTNGIYFINLITEDRTITKKFIKQ